MIIIQFQIGREEKKMRLVVQPDRGMIVEVADTDRAGHDRWSDASRGAPSVEFLLAKALELVAAQEKTIARAGGDLNINLGVLK